MTTYNIKNTLGDTIKVVEVNNEEELQDAIYDLKDYHGHMMQFTYEEVK